MESRQEPTKIFQLTKEISTLTVDEESEFNQILSSLRTSVPDQIMTPFVINYTNTLSVLEIIEHPQGGALFIAFEGGMWRYEDGNVRKLSLPEGLTKIYSSVYDAINGIVYISTINGIYYKDIANIR